MCFNPRTHEGCDFSALMRLTSWNGFNPRTHEGCDQQEFDEIYELWMFQSTHPRGVRQVAAANFPHFFSFNPRTHEGCDRNANV